MHDTSGEGDGGDQRICSKPRAPGTPHAFLRDLRAFLSRRRGDAVLLAEANLPPAEQRRFFGDEDGDEMHLLFDFIGNQRLFLSLARQDARPLARNVPRATRRQWRGASAGCTADGDG